MKNTGLVICAVAMVLGVSPLRAQEGDFRMIGAASWLERTGESGNDDSIPPVGTAQLETDFDSGAGVGVALAYYITDNLALEARGSVVRSEMSVRIRTSSDAVAVINLGDFELFPLGAVLQYHIPTSDRLRWFVGAGAGYLIVGDVDTAGTAIGAERIEFESSVGLIVNGGFNYNFGDRWALNADARYAPIETDSEALFVGRDEVEEIHVEPLIVSAGLSYRF